MFNLFARGVDSINYSLFAPVVSAKNKESIMKFVAILVSLFIATVNAKLRIKDPRATIQLGPHGDVSLTRSGPGKLEINANVAVTKGLMLEKDTRINGISLENLIRKLIAQKLGIPFIPVVHKKEEDSRSGRTVSGGKRNELVDLCRNISALIPFRGTSTIEEAIKGALKLEGILPDKTLAENFANLLITVLGKDTGGALASTPIYKLLPVDVRSTVGKAFTDLVRILLPGNFTSLPVERVVKELLAPLPPSLTVPEVAKMLALGFFFNGTTAPMYETPIGSLLPLPLDTRKTLGENVATLMKILPINSTWSLETTVTILLSVLRTDPSMSLAENIEKRVLPLVLGNATETILTSTIAKLLPVPFDTHKTLPGIMADIMKYLPPPINAIPTATLLEIVKAVMSVMPLPKDLTKILGDVVADTMVSILPGLRSMTLPDLMYPLVKAFLGNATDPIMKTSAGDLLGLPFHTSATIPEVVDSLVKGLKLPVNASATLAHNLETMFKVLPFDKRTPLAAMPRTLFTLFAGGNSTIADAILAEQLMKLLPVPLDTSKTLAQTMDALLPMLPLPLKNWTTAHLSDVATQLLKILPFDSSKALPEMITSLFKAIFPPDKKIIKEKVCKHFNISYRAATSLSPLSRDLGETLAKLEKAVVDGERTALFKFCEEADKVVGTLPHLLDTKISSLLPIDTTKTAPAVLAALLPVNQTSTIYGLYAAILPPGLDKVTIAALMSGIMFPAPPKIVALVPVRNGTNGTRGTKSSPAVAVPFPIDLTKPMSDNIAQIMKMLPVKPSDFVKGAVGIFEAGVNVTKAMASMLPYNASLGDLVKIMPLPPNITRDVSKMVSVLPRNVTDGLDSAVASTVTAFKSDPDTLAVLSHVLASMLPFGLKPEGIYKTLNDLRSDDDFLTKVLADVMPFDTTKSAAHLLGIDKKSSAEIMEVILDDLSRCESGLLGS